MSDIFSRAATAAAALVPERERPVEPARYKDGTLKGAENVLTAVDGKPLDEERGRDDFTYYKANRENLLAARANRIEAEEKAKAAVEDARYKADVLARRNAKREELRAANNAREEREIAARRAAQRKGWDD
ncbi:MAG: hypothetical protein ABI592_01140 [Acidobacteriota bacterium]